MSPSQDQPSNSVPKRPRLGGSRPPQHPNQSTSNLRGLTDLLGGTTSRADSALGDSAPADAWSSITKTLYELPSVQLPPLEHSIDVPIQQPQPLPSAYNLKNLKSLPLDLSLKTRVRVTSNIPLLWTSHRDPQGAYLAMEEVLKGNDNSITPLLLRNSSQFQHQSAHPSAPNHTQSNGPTQTGPHTVTVQQITDAHALFNRRLINFRFPSTVISATLASAWQQIFVAGKPTSRNDQMNTRLRAEAYHRLSSWQTAFQSIYFGYKNGRINNFYVIMQGAVVIFHRMTGEKQTPIAVLSPATAGVRSLLSDYTVQFTISPVRSNSSGTDEVYVKVKGEFNVHILYNFVLSVGHKISGSKDVPTVICDRPFIGGTPLVAVVDHARSARTDANALDDDHLPKSTQYNVQIRGYLTPHQLEGICQALFITQSSNFKARIETEPNSMGLNNLFVPVDDGTGVQAAEQASHKRGETISEVAAFPEMNGLFVQATMAAHSS